MFAVYRAINGISINGREYILNEDGSIMTWDSGTDTIEFLIANGIFYDEENDCYTNGNFEAHIEENFKKEEN